MKHSDCKNFTPLDAFKGLCRANGGMVMIDSDTCPQFAAAPKCRNCVHFCEPNEEEIGICKGLPPCYAGKIVGRYAAADTVRSFHCP